MTKKEFAEALAAVINRPVYNVVGSTSAVGRRMIEFEFPFMRSKLREGEFTVRVMNDLGTPGVRIIADKRSGKFCVEFPTTAKVGFGFDDVNRAEAIVKAIDFLIDMR